MTEQELPGLGVRRVVLSARRLPGAGDRADLVLLSVDAISRPDDAPR